MNDTTRLGLVTLLAVPATLLSLVDKMTPAVQDIQLERGEYRIEANGGPDYRAAGNFTTNTPASILARLAARPEVQPGFGEWSTSEKPMKPNDSGIDPECR